MEDIVKLVPAPTGDAKAPLRALIFDSQYDSYRGVIVYLRIREGEIRRDDEVKMMASARCTRSWRWATCVPWVLSPATCSPPATSVILPPASRTWRTLRWATQLQGLKTPQVSLFPGYKPAQPMVFSGIYTVDGAKYPDLRDSSRSSS